MAAVSSAHATGATLTSPENNHSYDNSWGYAEDHAEVRPFPHSSVDAGQQQRHGILVAAML